MSGFDVTRRLNASSALNVDFNLPDQAARVKRQLDFRVKAAAIAFSALGGAGAATVAGISAFVGYKVIKPRRRIMTEVSGDYLLPPQAVTFKSTDGLNLTGHFYPNLNSQRAVIICHGFHSGAVDVHDAAIIYQHRDFNVLSFDFRSCGGSGGRTSSVGLYEVRDLMGALEYIKTRPEVDPQRIAVHGYSMGGAVAMLATARSQDIKALVIEGSFGSLDRLLRVNFSHFYRLPSVPFRLPAVWSSRLFGQIGWRKIEPERALRLLQTTKRNLPVMIIHGENDRAIPVDEARRLYEAAPEPKELWVVPNCGHIVAYDVDRTEYVNRINAFLTRYIHP